MTRYKPFNALLRQELRCYELLRYVTTAALKRADPLTHGSFSLAEHWGNTEATQIVETYWKRHGRIAQAAEAVFEKTA